VILDHFRQQRVALVAVARDAEQQPVRVIELGAIEVAIGQLLHFGRVEIVAREHADDLLVLRAQAPRIEVGMDENLQAGTDGKCRG
jgi:hypothetical protein